MAAYLDKERINTAITDSTKFDLSHVHITTSNFMQLQPIYNKEMVPGEKLDVNLESFARMNPLPVPTFGRAMMKNRAYFVPYRTIFRGWNDFITDAPHTNSAEIKGTALLQKVPVVKNSTIITAFLMAGWTMYGQQMPGIVDASASDPSNPNIPTYDLVYRGASSNVYKKFTSAGRVANKVLESLGYKVNWNVNDETEFSALPLLALAKVYTDWYFPSAYTNSTDFNNLLLMCNSDTAAPYELTYTDVRTILMQCLFVCYDSDYFTSAWDNPTCPGANKVSNYKITNLDYVGGIRGGSTVYGNVEPAYVTNNQGVSSDNDRVAYASAPFISPYLTATTGSGNRLST